MNNTSNEPRASLGERLRLASLGVPTPPVARRIVAGCAALPLDVALVPSHGKVARLVYDVLSLRTIKEMDPARRNGWHVTGNCLAEAAWATEQLFRLGEVCRDQELGARIARRARRTQLALVLALRRSAGPAFVGEDRIPLQRTFDLPCSELLRACRSLVELDAQTEGADEKNVLALVDEASDRLCGVCPTSSETAVKDVLDLQSEPASAHEIRRSLIVRPFAAIWACGALHDHGRRLADPSELAPTSELERRLRSA